MTYIDEKTEEAREDKIYEEGGYIALWRYRIWKMVNKLKGSTTTCCTTVCGDNNAGVISPAEQQNEKNDHAPGVVGCITCP